MNRNMTRQIRTAIVAASLLATGICQKTAGKPMGDTSGNHQVVSHLPGDTLAELSESLQKLATKVSPTVVQIEVAGFGPAEKEDRKDTTLIVRQRGIGAGVIVDPEGYIMTNAHVVEGAHRVRVVRWLPPADFDDVSDSAGRQVMNASVVGMSRQADLALLKVDAHDLPAVHFRLDRPKPGELVFAIGSPEGLQNSVTMGVISSAWRQPDPENPMAYLQTDAPINAGNSGGPLLDSSGAVVGLNTFILSSSGGSEGLGFAIPARVVDFVYQSLRKYGRVPRVEIGVTAQTISPTLAEGLGLEQSWGLVIADVAPFGPADIAGVKPGDIVLAVDGHPMLSLLGFTAALYQHSPEQNVKIDLLRGSRKLSMNVPPVVVNDGIDQLADIADPVKSHIGSLGILALDLDTRTRSLVPGVRASGGVIVIAQARGFNSVNTGLRPGDVIHSLNQTEIQSVEQLKSTLAQLKPGAPAVLQVERRGQYQYLAFEME